MLLGERDSLFAPDEPYPRHFFAGGTFSVRHNRSVSYLSPPIDLLSNVDVVLENEEFDVLHIHEPFVPSLGWTAMNHAECPIVATFHANSERFFWYWLGQAHPQARLSGVRRRRSRCRRRRATRRRATSPGSSAWSPTAST